MKNDFKIFLCEYQHQGETWAIEVKATDRQDAQHRLQSMQRGIVLGEVALKVEPPRLSWLKWLFGMKK